MGALEDITVADFTHHVAGPTCTAMLADLGANVIKVEPIETGEAGRRSGTHTVAGGRWSTSFFVHNRNKRSVAIDLKREQGRAAVRDIAAAADVLVENFRPGVMERLGLGYADIAALNSRLVYCSITGFGTSGPYQAKPALDIVMQAMGGLMSLTGEPGGSPVPAGAPLADIASGIYAAVGVLAALHERARTGAGQHVEVPMLDVVTALMAPRFQQFLATGVNLLPLGAGHPQACPWETFAANDGPFVLAVNTDQYWQRLCAAIGRPDLGDDARFAKAADRVRRRSEISAALSTEFAQHSRQHWMAILDRAGVANGPVLTLAETVADPQAKFNEIFPAIDCDGDSVQTVRNPIRLGGTPQPRLEPPALLGADTSSVLSESGYTDDQIRALGAAGAIGLGEAR